MSKPRHTHTATVTPYDYWADPGRRPMYQWICDCGELRSGYVTASFAQADADDHADRESSAVASAAFLAVGTVGWIAAGTFAAVLAVVLAVWGFVMWRAARRAPTVSWSDSPLDGPDGKPDPAKLWGLLNTDRMPPERGDMVRIPGYVWVFDGDDWQAVR